METPTPTPSVPTPTPTTTPAPAPVRPQVPHRSAFLSWFAILLVIAVLGFGYYAIGSDQGWWPFPEPAPFDELTGEPVDTSSPSPEASPVVTEDPRAGWETYSDDSFGVTLLLPPEWTFQGPSDIFPEIVISDGSTVYTTESTGTYSPTLYISMRSDTYEGSIEVYEEAELHPSLHSLRQEFTTTIGEVSAFVYSGITPPTAHEFWIVFFDGKVLRFSLNTPLIEAEQGTEEAQAAREELMRILSTVGLNESTPSTN